MAISRIRAAVSYSSPIAAVTVSESGAIGLGTVPLSAVQWINIVYSVEVDYRGLNPVLSEIAIVVTDEVAKGFSTRVTEAQLATDELQPFVLEKALREDKTLTELVVYDFRKELSDLVDATDDLLGEANIDDDQVMFFVKGAIQDHASTSEFDILNFGKNLEESKNAVDSDPLFNIDKPLVDEPTVSEAVGVDYQKPLSDSADAGDELNGVVESDDGQTFFLQTSRSDSFTATDSAVPEFGKAATESLSAADELQPFTLGKAISDTPSTEEQRTYFVAKPLSDSYSVDESLASNFATSKSDTAQAQNEGPNIIEDYVTVGYFAEQYAGNGGPKRDVGKGIADAAETSDEIAVAMQFNRSLTDSVDATDDFDGVATSEDDQTMSMAKARTDLAHPTDSLAFAGSFVRSDTFGASDVLTHLVGRSLQDSWTVSDQHSTGFGKGLTDSASTSESQVFNINKALADTADATDDFDGAATAEDDQTMQFVTNRSETATASESASLLAGKGLADSASTGDSGSLRMQGYCDDSYFAGTYLGISITF